MANTTTPLPLDGDISEAQRALIARSLPDGVADAAAAAGHDLHRCALAAATREMRGGGGRYGSNKTLADAVGVSAAAISHLCNDDVARWPKPDSPQWDKLRRFFRTDGARALAKQPLTDYVELPTSRRIISALAQAHHGSDGAVIYGDSGAGKTMAARKYAADNAGVVIASASPATRSIYGVLSLIWDSIVQDDAGAGTVPRNAAQMEAAIVRHFRARPIPRLLVIDEAHHLPQSVLDEVRCIYDRLQGDTPFGFALLGNMPLMSTLRARAAAPQLLGRLGRQVRVAGVAKGEVAAMVAAAGGDESDRQLLTASAAAASENGGLRRLVKVLRDAMRLATARGEELSAQHVADAEVMRAADRAAA